MFRILKITGLLAIIASTASPAFAGPDCTCRYKGQDVAEGQVICMELPSGAVLAQCSRVLNNTSWKTLQKGCPYSSAPSEIQPSEQAS